MIHKPSRELWNFSVLWVLAPRCELRGLRGVYLILCQFQLPPEMEMSASRVLSSLSSPSVARLSLPLKGFRHIRVTHSRCYNAHGPLRAHFSAPNRLDIGKDTF
jgi:hypothetical protein